MKEVTQILTVIFSSCVLLSACVGEPEASEAEAPARLEILSDHAQTLSFFGDTLFSPPEASEAALANLAEAEAAYRADPEDPDALIWYGRRMAYAGRYRSAINAFSEGIENFPQDARIYRHRGHRYITLRMLDEAIADFEHASTLIEGKEDVVEPDGAPNAMNIPVSSLNTNIWYHLGLAYYLKDDMENARRGFQACLDNSRNDDMAVASSHWLYMILRRLGRDAEAAATLEPISAEMEIIENMAYHDLLLFYRGELPESDLSGSDEAMPDFSNSAIAYGVGNWYFYNGQTDRAKEIFQQITSTDRGWGGFGYIAAEADLSRMQ